MLMIKHIVRNMNGLSALVFVSLLAVIAGSPAQRIVGGSQASLSQYPFVVSLQAFMNNQWFQACGGAVITNTAVLSAAHCTVARTAAVVRSRVGTTLAHSGGIVHNTASIRNHPQYSDFTFDNDICIVRTSAAISLTGNVRSVRVAGATYNLADNQPVWVIGWGLTSWGGSPSEQLLHVQILTANQNTCRSVYSQLTANMLCAGWNAGGRGFCSRDSGGPLLHNGVVVGVVSFSRECARPNTPGVFARVSRYASWIQQNT